MGISSPLYTRPFFAIFPRFFATANTPRRRNSAPAPAVCWTDRGGRATSRPTDSAPPGHRGWARACRSWRWITATRRSSTRAAPPPPPGLAGDTWSTTAVAPLRKEGERALVGWSAASESADSSQYGQSTSGGQDTPTSSNSFRIASTAWRNRQSSSLPSLPSLPSSAR